MERRALLCSQGESFTYSTHVAASVTQPSNVPADFSLNAGLAPDLRSIRACGSESSQRSPTTMPIGPKSRRTHSRKHNSFRIGGIAIRLSSVYSQCCREHCKLCLEAIQHVPILIVLPCHHILALLGAIVRLRFRFSSVSSVTGRTPSSRRPSRYLRAN